MNEIEFKQVSKLYDKDVIAIEDVSLEIAPGEFMFVIGKSGSGKSTLLKLISRQLLPTAGEVWVRGHEVAKLTRRQIPYFQRQFGIMQADLGLLKELTIAQNIEFVMRATEQPRSLMKTRVRQTLATVGIPHCSDSYPNQVSVGEAARAMLARAIVMNPHILVVDEPTANLDPDASWDMMCLLQEINRLGVTVVVASHSRELVTIMKKRVVTLVSGAVVADEKKAIYNSRATDIFEERRILHERERKKKL